MSVAAPPGWYPDPGRAHQYRYFDGGAWTDHVSDNGVAAQAPLGPTPPGMIGWHPPGVMVQNAYAVPNLPRVPRVKMWIFAVLSIFIFWIDTDTFRIALPLGVLFAISCWQLTKEPLRAHEQAGSPAVGEMKAARIVALVLATLNVIQALSWMR